MPICNQSEEKYTLKRDDIRLAAITYQSFGLDKNKGTVETVPLFLTLYTVIAQQIFCLKIVIVRKTIQFQRVAKCHNDSPVLQLRNSTIIFALQFSQKFQGSYSEYAFPQDFCEVNVPSHTDSEFPK